MKLLHHQFSDGTEAVSTPDVRITKGDLKTGHLAVTTTEIEVGEGDALKLLHEPHQHTLSQDAHGHWQVKPTPPQRP